jgi:hypothetical protein
VYEGKGDGCDILLYAESFGLTIEKEKVIDLLGLDKNTTTCR